MAWAADVDATQLTSITSEQFFSFSGSTWVTLNPGETANIQVKVDFPSTPTDHALVSVYATMDSSSEVSDTSNTPLFGAFQIPNSPDPGIATYVIRGVYKFRVGLKRSGSTDTLTTGDATLRKDGVSV